jgi:c-di-GMP-related signal transduction protein
MQLADSVLVARQPILDGQLDVSAYRLFAHASGVQDAFADLHAERSDARVLNDAFLEMDIHAVTGGKPAHLPVTRELLVDGVVTLLPPAGLVPELPADVGADDRVLGALTDLRARGYRIALGGYVAGDERSSLPADIAKVPADAGAAAAVRDARAHGLHVVVCDVGDAATYLTARNLAPDGYQGSFLHGPALVKGRRFETSSTDYLALLRAVQQADLDFNDIEERIKRDVTLSWKFLNYANAAFFGWRARMTTIRQVLVLLGEAGVRRWVTVATTSALAEGLPAEMVTVTLTRARFAENLAEAVPQEVSALHAFVAGMFSMLDAFVDEPLDRLLAQVALPDDVSVAILSGDGVVGTILQVVKAYEQGRWDVVERSCERLRLDPRRLVDCYVGALEWASRDVPSSAATPSAS